MNFVILDDVLIIFALAVAVLLICHRIHVPLMVGLILTGMLAGPYGLKLVHAVDEVRTMSEIGVALLLFTIGLEFSFNRLLAIKRAVLLGGMAQVGLTFLAGFVSGLAVALPIGTAVFIGFLFSLSSTAIVLKLLQARAQVDTPHGRTTLGILIFQDIVIVPMVLITPMLAGITGGVGKSPLVLLAEAIVILALAYLGAKYIVPQILFQVTKTRNRELFLLTILVICLGVAALTYHMGLSLALGAFLAGLIISESEYSYDTFEHILPFRDVFLSFFFVSVGMLINLKVFIEHAWVIVLVAAGILVLKAILAGAATLIVGSSLRTAILTGLALAQVGEFSFVLADAGARFGLFPGQSYQDFLAVIVLTMLATPAMIGFSPRLTHLILHLPWPQRLRRDRVRDKFGATVMADQVRDHIIIVGFGVTGRHLARAAKLAGISYVVVETNPITVKQEKTKGQPIYYGDATHAAVLSRFNITAARIIVVAVNDAMATHQITSLAKRMNPNVCVIARARFLQEIDVLYNLGADEVIPQEFETSVEIFTRVLTKYLVPKDIIEKFTAEVRTDRYQMFRRPANMEGSVSDLTLHLSNVEISSLRVGNNSPVVDKSLSNLELRQKYGVTLLAINRQSQLLSNPGGDMTIHADDILVVMGRPEQIADLAGKL